MKTRVISVKLKSLESISEKAYKATAFDGSTAIIPKSQVFADDFEVWKSEAYWIAEWILKQKELQYSDKKSGWYNPATRKIEPDYHCHIETHVPKPIDPIDPKPDESLIR